MAKIELVGGAYEARSIIANAQRCLNLYPEKNPADAAAQYTHYPTPGLTTLAQGITAPVRGLYTASNDKLYTVIGPNVYLVAADWTLTLLGVIAAGANGPVRMHDNSQFLVLVDNSAFGYTIDLATNAFAGITDPAFYGATHVDYLDSYMLFNRPDTKQFYSTLSNVLTFDPLYFAQKTSSPDKLVALGVKNREIWLVGRQTTEVWYNVGGTSFPFAIVPGTKVETGCVAPYSLAKDSASMYWLSQNERGQAVIIRTQGYEPQKVSTFALEAEWERYSRIDDAIGFCYQSGGHLFYVLTFPTADKTWVFDAVEGLWHERGWMDDDGFLHRHRANCHAFAYGTHVVGDFENGKLYRLDNNVYTDDGQPILRLRSFPHLGSEGKRIVYNQFIADMEVGTPPVTATLAPLVNLRWSDTRGASWSEMVQQSIGNTGKFLTVLQWRRLGIARDRVFELSWSFPYKTALNGAYVEPTVCMT